MEPAEVKRAQRELYEAGEYWALARVLAPAAASLVRACRVGAGDRVLDVAAGDGNVAVEAARRGATVAAADLSPVQVDRGRARTHTEGLAVEWLVADAERLPFADGSFDRVLSAFGAVFAPDPARVASELFRVCRPGGTVGLTAWPPGSLVGELTAAVREAVAPEPFPDLELEWGVEQVARERLSRWAAEVSCERLSLRYDEEARGAAGERDCAAVYGRANVPESRRAAVQAARETIVRRHTGPDGVLRAEYLLVVALKR